MLDVQHLQKSYGTQVVLQDVSFQVGNSEKVGLIGRNGSGKTTVLEIICGSVAADSGRVMLSRGSVIGHLSQDSSLTDGATVYDEALSVFRELLSLEREIANLTRVISEKSNAARERPSSELAEKLAHLQEEFEAKGGYQFRSQTMAVLSGLKFDEGRLTQQVTTLSGGEKTRLRLAKLLLAEPDLLLLDEPTNHLDVSSVEWFESFLTKYKRAVLVVSHDRYFLDRVATKIVEIDRGIARSFHGNYTRFVQLKSEALERQLKEWELQQRDIARRQEIVDRFMQYGLNFHKKAKSKAKLLAKLQRVEKPQEQESIYIKLTGRRSGEQVLSVENLMKSFGCRAILKGVQLRLMRGDRVALLGANGAGKSTLLQILAQRLRPDAGEVRYGVGVDFAFYEQESSDLQYEQDVITNFTDSVDMSPGEARSLLAQFLFRGDDVYKLVGDLSGGEQSRLRLAMIVARRPNLILLDEPTNHLDIASIEALESALDDFDGTLLFVTHDRYFVEKIAARVYELVDGELVEYHGGYCYYLEKRSERQGGRAARSAAESQKTMGAANLSYEMQKSLRSRRAELARTREQLDDVEDLISQQERAVEALTSELAQPSVYSNPDRSLEVTERLSQAECALESLFAEWESIYREVETVESEVRELEAALGLCDAKGS